MDKVQKPNDSDVSTVLFSGGYFSQILILLLINKLIKSTHLKYLLLEVQVFLLHSVIYSVSV
jgi:hypothetical protein